MARFPFSITGRKKQNELPPPIGSHMSKAHRILGSTPLNIDAPGSWDDVSSLMASDDKSTTTGASYPESELRGHEYDQHRVAIARSDEDWDGESDIITHPSKRNDISFEDPTQCVQTNATGVLRKSRSSSTIRSWYDKSKLPLSISQQTSSSAIAKGLPLNFQSGLNPVGVEEGIKTKKKPSKLNFSRASRKESKSRCQEPAAGSGLDGLLRSPSIISSFSVKSTRSRESRTFQKKRTKKGTHFPIPEALQPVTSDGNRSGHGLSRELPSLYSHYEQMSLRHVMRQKSTPSLMMTENGILTLQNVAEVSYDGHEDEIAAHHQQKSMVHTQPSKTLRSLDKSLEGADLLQTSVLMLSSDSEDDDVEQEPTITRPSAPTPAIKPSKEKARAPRLEECQSNMVCGSRPGKKRPSQSTKQGKRTIVPPSSTYITSLGFESRLRTPAAMDSRSGTPFGSFSHTASSPRASIGSYSSMDSGITWQGKPGYRIKEAPAMAVLPVWRSSGTKLEEMQDEPLITNRRVSTQPILDQALSGDQLTPPLSPMSVDFDNRSAHSSVNGAGSHSRLMAVTHQEEVLLSAIRHKQQAMRRASMPQVSEESEVEKVASIEGQPRSCSREQQGMESDKLSDDSEAPAEKGHQKGHRPKDSQTSIIGSTFEFGFPAPPSFKNNANIQTEQSLRRLKFSGVPPPIQIQGVVLRGDSLPTSPAGPPPTHELPKLPKHARNSKSSTSRDNVNTQSQQDVTRYFDDSEPSPDLSDIQDWESATSPATDAVPPGTLLAISWPQHKGGQASGKQVLPSPILESESFLYPNGFSRPYVSNQVANQEGEETFCEDKDIPRPDSPISPEAFPAVPTRRITLGNMVR